MGGRHGQERKGQRWQTAFRKVLPCRDRASLHAMGPTGSRAMITAAATRVSRLGEFHRFSAAGAHFLYLVPAGAIFAVDDAVGKLIDCLRPGEFLHDDLVARLAAGGIGAQEAEELIAEMYHAGVIVAEDAVPEPPQILPEDFPMQTLVMNLTNQCNLSCQYCYEFGADKLATPEGKPKFMDRPTARTAVDFLFAQSG